MSVGTATTGTQQTGISGTSMNYNGLTVPSGSSNPALIFGFSLYASGGVAAAGISATWDFGGTNQAMDFIGTAPIVSGVDYCGLFGLVNPTPGNLTLRMTWSNACIPNGCCNHLTGVDQTGGSTTWLNFGTNALTSATPNFNMGATYNSGASPGNTSLLYATCIIQLSTLSSVSGASWYTASSFNSSPQRSAGGMYALPSTSTTTMTWTLAGSAATAMAGIEIKPAAGAGFVPLAGQSPEIARLAKAGMPRGLAGMPPLITASLPIVAAPPPPVVGSTLPIMGVG